MKSSPSTAQRIMFVFLLIGLVFMASCSKDSEEEKSTATPETKQEAQTSYQREPLISAYSLQAYRVYGNAVSQVQELEESIRAFLDDPNETTLINSQQTWIKAHHAYLRTLVFKQLSLMHGTEDIPLHTLSQRIDMWPIEPGYVDFIDGYPLTGIVNDLTLNIELSVIQQQHQFADPSYASLGFHPLEFLLFGEDSQRSYMDFLPDDSTAIMNGIDNTDTNDSANVNPTSDLPPYEEASATAEIPNEPQNHNRRRAYLQLLSRDLVVQLQIIQGRWQTSQGMYTKQLAVNTERLVLKAIVQSMLDTLTETLLSENIISQNTHSEFSKTPNESENWAAIFYSVQQIYFNTGEDTDEPLTEFSLHQTLSELDSELANQMELKFESVERAILAKPFNLPVLTKELDELVMTLSQASVVLGLPAKM